MPDPEVDNFWTSGFRNNRHGGMHWTAQYNNGNTNFMFMNPWQFDNFEGQGSFRFFSLLPHGSFMQVADPQGFFDYITSGFNFHFISAFGKDHLVSSLGPLGNLIVHDNGGIRFGNSTAGLHLSSIAATSRLLLNPTGTGIRSDAGGDGHWGSSRGSRTHNGIDFVTTNSQNVVSPINGRVRNFVGKTSGHPMIQVYPTDTNIGFDYIEILYATAPLGVQPWIFRNVSAGDIIGAAANLQELGYPDNVGPHIHLQIWQSGSRIDPTPFFFNP